jgi:hypothetical protein
MAENNGLPQVMTPAAMLARLGRRQLLEELSEAMYVVAEEVINTGKKGAVTVTFTISQAARGEPQVIINEEVKRTAPKRDPLGASLYLGEGGFYERDPRQQAMDFRVVEGEQAEVRTIEPAEATVRSV